MGTFRKSASAKSNKTGNKTKSEKPAIKKGGLIIKAITQYEGVHYAELENIHKAELQHIRISDLPKDKPDFNSPGTTRDMLIAEWLIKFISSGLKSGRLTTSHLLPKKGDVANYLGVSAGTVQNAIRYIEDQGYVVSKQRIGTIISTPDNQNTRLRKLTSKRDVAVLAIKKLIKQKRLTIGEALPSAREVAKLIGSAPNTTRLALEYLASVDIIEDRGYRGNKANWFVQAIPDDNHVDIEAIASETLIDQIEFDLKSLIAEQYQVGDKLPSHLELAEVLKVSIKTVHDAMTRIIDQGYVQSLRGRYGSYVIQIPDVTGETKKPEGSVIPDAVRNALQYNYIRVEQQLGAYISEKFRTGDKLPTMVELAEALEVSSNTIRKALQNLAKNGYLRFERGRYGGTYVVKLPKVTTNGTNQDGQYIAINAQKVKSYTKKTVVQ